MNQAARNYWDTYWGNRVQPQSVYAFQFGDEPDKLAELVRSGQKTDVYSRNNLSKNKPIFAETR